MLGRFEILGQAARGGMGTVFRARDHRDRRDVALKVLRLDVPGHAERFAREAALLAGLRHPHIVEYISHGATPDGLRFLVMEWVAGETLAQRLAGAGMSTAAVVAVAIQLCRALAALHAHQVVHRDLKPSNVMLVGGELPHVKLVDLGIARSTGAAGRLTRTGVVIGTAGYLAPELVRGQTAEIDPRADLFALGCVLYECLTGQAAFRGDTTLAIRAKVLVHDPPRLAALDPAMPPALDALVAALLARQPAQRPADAARVERMLDELGALPAELHRSRGRELDRTRTAAAGPLCGILAIGAGAPGPWPMPELDAPVIASEAFDDGVAVVVAGDLARAARVALALARAFPAASVAVAAGASVDDCLAQCARLLAEVEITAPPPDTCGPGVWLEPRAADQLGPSYRLASAGRHARIVDPRTEAS
ncbi:MAG TPA: serine/threonine-protein kinase [Kofleriaceae bacterium]|nr:serine/threonine-protein kinase [Kofleriaceae bacterium]